MYRILVATFVAVVGSLVSVASPASAASGPWLSVTTALGHTCAVSSGHSLYCWGLNENAQIGDGASGPGNNRLAPKRIGTAGAWASVSASNTNTCAVTTGKSLYCWGTNQAGQIGDGTTTFRPTPRKVGASGVWASVSVGGAHTCAISAGKSLYCWGFNETGQVGDGTNTDRVRPKKVGTSGVWESVSVGARFTCGVSTGKTLYCWGQNLHGQVGDGTTTNRNTPRKIGTAGAFAKVDAGFEYACAVSTGQSLYCWGSNSNGQIGAGIPPTDRLTPKKIGSTGAWAAVGAGSGTTCAVTTAKSLYCWGANNFGQIGDGTTTPRLAPKKIGSTGAWATPATGTGGSHSCVISAGKALYCWGGNGYGQIGDGTTTERHVPRKIA